MTGDSVVGSLLLAGLLLACREPAGSQDEARVEPESSMPEAAHAPRRCAPPPGIDASPTSIADAMVLLGALPPPVTVACFVESLDRPLRVFASASPFSAQPAEEAGSPRIFIRNGPLTLAVVATGSGRRLLEFSEHAGPGRTIKGEVELPPEGPLRASAPYDRVRIEDGTSCGTCHDDEAPASDDAVAFASEVLRPPAELDFPVQTLRREAADCDPARDAQRCELLAALFDHGEVLPGTLPSGGRLCDH